MLSLRGEMEVLSLSVSPCLHYFQTDILKISVQRTGKPFPLLFQIVSDVSTLLKSIQDWPYKVLLV